MLVGLTPARSAIIGTVTRSLPRSLTSSSTAVRTLWMTAALRPPVLFDEVVVVSLGNSLTQKLLLLERVGSNIPKAIFFALGDTMSILEETGSLAVVLPRRRTLRPLAAFVGSAIAFVAVSFS